MITCRWTTAASQPHLPEIPVTDGNLYVLTGDPRDDIDIDVLLFTIAIHTRNNMSLADLLVRFHITSMEHHLISTFFDLDTGNDDAKAGQDESVLFLLGELWRHWMDTHTPRDVPLEFDVDTCANMISESFSRYGWGDSIRWLWNNIIVPLDQRANIEHRYAIVQALWNGIAGNHLSVVQWALGAGADIDAPREDGEYPITLACKHHADAAIELLLKAECDLTMKDPQGRSASDLLAAYNARM